MCPIILAEQRSFDGDGVPDMDRSLFCELLLSRTLYQYQNDKDIYAIIKKNTRFGQE